MKYNYYCDYCETYFSIISDKYTDGYYGRDITVCPICGSSRIYKQDKGDYIKSSYKIEFIKLSQDAIPFKYSHPNDACMDMYSPKLETIEPGKTKIIYTDIAIAIPQGYEGRIIGRSGNSSKGIHVSHGVVDEEYRGNIGVIITNLNENDKIVIYPRDRIAQFSIHKVYRIEMREVTKLPETERQDKGFGSSGL